MKRFLIEKWIFFILFSFSSCSVFSSDDEKIVDKITEKTAKELKTQKNLCLVGTGGQMMYDIKMLAMSFYYYQEVNLRTARELVVYAINKYLSEINSSKEIKPYLHTVPFTAKNIEISIWVFEPNGSNPPLDKIHYISAINGNISYYLDLPETYSRQVICEETYEEALHKIDLNQNSKLGKEEDEPALQHRQSQSELTKPLSVTQDPEKMQLQTAEVEKEPSYIFAEYSEDEPLKSIANSIHTIEEYGPVAALLNHAKQFVNLCNEESILFEEKKAELDFEHTFSEEVFFDLTKITKKKKKLEDFCVEIDESEKKLEKYVSDYLQSIASLTDLDDERTKKLAADSAKTGLLLGKQSFAVIRGIVTESIHLLNFLSIRYGTYQLVIEKKGLTFSSEIESKLYGSYIKKIETFFQENERISFLVQQHKVAIYEEAYKETLREADVDQAIAEIGAFPKDGKKTIFREAVAKDGAKVSIVADNLEHSIFQMSGEGFKPNESVNFISTSYQEVIHAEIKADENGNIPSMGMLPAVVGKSGGVCHIDLLRESGPIHIQLPWGAKQK